MHGLLLLIGLVIFTPIFLMTGWLWWDMAQENTPQFILIVSGLGLLFWFAWRFERLQALEAKPDEDQKPPLP